MRNKRKALIVGINEYPAPATLTGCVNDAAAWYEYLKKRKFETEVLTDQIATRQGILDGLRDLILGAEKNDVLIFVYSGHGTNVKDLDADEDDARDEALVPIDYKTGALIIDDDLRSIFDTLNPNITLTVFLDSCYSGTATRILGVNATRTEKNGTRVGRYLRLSDKTHKEYEEFRNNYDGSKAILSPDKMNHVTISACTPQEVAYEHDGMGDFTRAAIDVLNKAGTSLGLSGFLKRVISNMGEDRWQTPTFDGPLHMLKRTIVSKIK